jgi:hypothetical protein
MQKIIFFTPVVETGKLSTIISEKSVSELKEEGIIPSSSSTLVRDYDITNNVFMYNVYHINFFQFDNPENPTDIVFNKEMFCLYFIDAFRQKRNELFDDLDLIQNRALITNKLDVVAEIEADKQILRDMPDNFDFSSKDVAQDFYLNLPLEVFVDYKAKYEPKLK